MAVNAYSLRQVYTREHSMCSIFDPYSLANKQGEHLLVVPLSKPSNVRFWVWKRSIYLDRFQIFFAPTSHFFRHHSGSRWQGEPFRATLSLYVGCFVCVVYTLLRLGHPRVLLLTTPDWSSTVPQTDLSMDEAPDFSLLKRVWDYSTSITRMRKQEAIFYQQAQHHSARLGLSKQVWQSERL